MRRTRPMLNGLAAAFIAALFAVSAWGADYGPVSANGVVDLSALVSMSRRQYWPGGQRHHQPVIVPYIQHGDSAYSADLLIVDNDTGTQLDCPPHMMPKQESGLPNAGYWGFMTCDKLPAWQLVGQVVRIDGRKILGQAPNGISPIFTVDMIKQAEKALGRDLSAGDAVLYWSGYDDKHDAPGTSPDDLIFDAVRGKHAVWPGPNWDTSDYVGGKGVRLVGLDSPSIGAFGAPDLEWKGTQSYRSQTFKAIESHLGVFKHGAIDVEGLGNLDQVPNGSIFIALPVKIEDTPTVQTRAVAITDAKLAGELAKAVRAQRVVDLSVLNAEDTPVYWAGEGVGNYSFPFFRIKHIVYYDSASAPYWVNSQIMDSRVGTHISPPAHYGLPPGFNVGEYKGEAKTWAQEFESKYGKLKNTDMTSDKVPVHQLMGPARVINVQSVVGTVDPKSLPASPKIGVDQVKAYEQQTGPIQAGEVVIFHTGHTDAHFEPVTRGRTEATMKAPLDGQTEGWPAPTPETIQYLAGKGVKHLAIDAPSMGSVNAKERAMSYWAGANAGMVFTEYLMGVGQLPAKGAFYVFLNPKIENNHGGPGRAIAILP